MIWPWPSPAANLPSGAVVDAATGQLSATSPVQIASAGTLDITSVNQTVGGLTGVTGSSVLTGPVGNAGTLTVNPTTAGTFAGVISGAGGLTVGGTAALTISGANTYTGNTTVNAGGVLNVVGSLATTGNVNANGTVNFGAASTSATTILTRMKNNINVGAAGVVTIAPAATHATRTLLIANSVNFASTTTGTFDLANNDMELTRPKPGRRHPARRQRLQLCRRGQLPRQWRDNQLDRRRR